MEGPRTLSHHEAPRHAYYMSRIHMQPTNQGSIFRAAEISLRPAKPAKKQHICSTKCNKTTHKNQTRTCNTQGTHTKDVFFEHLCSSTCSCLPNLPFTTYHLPRTNPEETRYSNLQKRYPSWTETGGVEPPVSLCAILWGPSRWRPPRNNLIFEYFTLRSRFH